MPTPIAKEELLYRFAGSNMNATGVHAPGGTSVITHLTEGGYEGSGLLSLEQYTTSGHFSYNSCKARFGLGRDYVFITALRVIAAAVELVLIDGHSQSGALVEQQGKVGCVSASDYHDKKNGNGEKYFHFNDTDVPNVGELVLVGKIPRNCWFVGTQSQIDQIIKAKGAISWDLGWTVDEKKLFVCVFS